MFRRSLIRFHSTASSAEPLTAGSIKYKIKQNFKQSWYTGLLLLTLSSVVLNVMDDHKTVDRIAKHYHLKIQKLATLKEELNLIETDKLDHIHDSLIALNKAGKNLGLNESLFRGIDYERRNKKQVQVEYEDISGSLKKAFEEASSEANIDLPLKGEVTKGNRVDDATFQNSKANSNESDIQLHTQTMQTQNPITKEVQTKKLNKFL